MMLECFSIAELVAYIVCNAGPPSEFKASLMHWMPSATNNPASFLSLAPLELIRALTLPTCGELRLSIMSSV
jgi:hypothetical protein